MYKSLNRKEMQRFINRYFKGWDEDIKSVSVITYDNVDEYLINGHYIFLAIN